MARPIIVLTAVLWLGCGDDRSGDGVLLRGPEINSRMQWVGLTSSSVGRALSHKTIWSCILFSEAVWIVLDTLRFEKIVRVTVWTLNTKSKSKSTTDSRSVRTLRLCAGFMFGPHSLASLTIAILGALGDTVWHEDGLSCVQCFGLCQVHIFKALRRIF
jgi:hypothetical protein